MLAPRYWPLVAKSLLRQPVRSLLTIGGVAVAMTLFAGIQSIQSGLRAATEVSAADAELVVYRQDRFCPFTSNLPEDYGRKIAGLSGVERVLPTLISVNNCRASLDVVTHRGIPKAGGGAEMLQRRTRLLAGSFETWKQRSDAALIGRQLAERRGLKVGQSFEAAGITVTVAGIIDSEEPQDLNCAYVDLPFLQQAASHGQLGVVTQFQVRVSDPTQREAVANTIDQLFASDREPTTTRAEKAHVARAAGDLLELVAFTRYVGIGCALAVLALIGNAIVLAVQARVSDHAAMRAIGYPGHLIGRLVLAEGLLVGLVGGALGAGAAVAALKYGSFALSNEGLSINFEAGPEVWGTSLLAALALGALAGLAPAIQAARRPLLDALRAE